MAWARQLWPLRVTARLGRDWQAFRGAVFLTYRRELRDHIDAWLSLQKSHIYDLNSPGIDFLLLLLLFLISFLILFHASLSTVTINALGNEPDINKYMTLGETGYDRYFSNTEPAADLQVYGHNYLFAPGRAPLSPPIFPYILFLWVSDKTVPRSPT